MKRINVLVWIVAFALAALALGVVAARADAQTLKDLTPRLIHGPLMGVTTVRQGADDRYHASVFNGAGYKVGVSLVDANDFSWLSVGLPNIVSIDSANDEFAYSMGLDLALAGNFGVGAVYDLIRTGGEKDSGLFTGYTDKHNLTFLFSFTLPLGGGGVVNGYR